MTTSFCGYTGVVNEFQVLAFLFVIGFSWCFGFVVNKGFEGGGPLAAIGLTPKLFRWGGLEPIAEVDGEATVSRGPNFLGHLLMEGCDLCTGFWGGLAASVLSVLLVGGGLAFGALVLWFLSLVFFSTVVHYFLLVLVARWGAYAEGQPG